MSEAPGTIGELRRAIPLLHEDLKGKTGEEYIQGLTKLSQKIVEHVNTAYVKETDFNKTLKGWADQLERTVQNEDVLQKLENGEEVEFITNTVDGKGVTHQHNQQPNSKDTATTVHDFLNQLGDEYIQINKRLGGLRDKRESPSSIITTIAGSPDE